MASQWSIQLFDTKKGKGLEVFSSLVEPRGQLLRLVARDEQRRIGLEETASPVFAEPSEVIHIGWPVDCQRAI